MLGKQAQHPHVHVLTVAQNRYEDHDRQGHVEEVWGCHLDACRELYSISAGRGLKESAYSVAGFSSYRLVAKVYCSWMCQLDETQQSSSSHGITSATDWSIVILVELWGIYTLNLEALFPLRHCVPCAV